VGQTRIINGPINDFSVLMARQFDRLEGLCQHLVSISSAVNELKGEASNSDLGKNVRCRNPGRSARVAILGDSTVSKVHNL
jgi:hypothetical protein